MFRSDSVPPLRDKDREVLHHQSIDDNGPGTILRDFEMLLGHIAPDGIPVSGTFDLLPQKSLPQLSGQLVRPIKIGLQRPQLKSFPHIQGMYLLLRATGLARVARTRGGGRLHLAAAGLQSWQGLGPTERYFTLLEFWLFRSRPEILGERDDPLVLPIFRWAESFRRIPSQGAPGGRQQR